MPALRPIRRRFDVAVGRCRGCGRRHQGRHPLQTSDALGAAASMLGPGAVALATRLNKELGLSPVKVSRLLDEQFGISVTPGGVVGAIARQARCLEPTYAALVEGVRASPVVAPDETGWRVDGSKTWLWAFVGEDLTAYLIAAGRGYEQAVEVLGADFGGVLERPERFGQPDSELGFTDERKVSLGELIGDVGDRLLYTYDFGDDWEHAE